MVKETSEIVKLTERISKDPKSKLFVPLAEEYKKAGDLEMAIYVLTEGLKNNPGYITARSILGRLLLDQGDLAGAKKELEEVVKVIPDNLLAQRKLGDICARQNNSSESLKHYKSVLALNPRDNEVASLISKLEAALNASSPKPEPATPPPQERQEVKPPQEVASVSIPLTAQVQTEAPVEAAPIPVAPPAAAAEPEPTNVAEPMRPAEPVSEEVVAPVSAVEKQEEKSVEKMQDLEKSDLELLTVDFDLPSEHVENQEPSSEKLAEIAATSHDQPNEKAATNELFLTEADLFAESLQEDTSSSSKESDSFVLEESIPAQTPPVSQKIPAEESSEKSDDFTTDTLAELYIAQGFYEKAIDIYERMLVDNPNSSKLKDKLDRVKAMVLPSAAPEQEETPKGSADIFAEPQVYSAQEEPPTGSEKISFSAEPSDEPPVLETKEIPLSGEALSPGAFAELPDQEFSQAKPAYTDFEAREYVPPEPQPSPVETKTELEHIASKSPTTLRNETIHRLEAWLKNIKKET